MQTYIAYTRVSTTRQVLGVSLAEQRSAIERYATARNLHISQWFEEVRTAASSRRSMFQTIMGILQNNRDTGLILHKVDRGARNLKDWATLGELIDHGVDVRFAHDDLDLETRGGRLTADIQAVIAADYIRNLREEVRKGIHGRLEQGLYPFQAPIGYRDHGRGRTKTPDPVTAPLVVHAFRAYATGDYTLNALSQELYKLGLSGHTDQPLSPTTVSNLLRRPFYVGTCKVRGVELRGIHQPLISHELFDEVQRLLRKRRPGRRTRHTFRYARRLECQRCTRSLTGERQKGHTYYRCHQCAGVSVREEVVDRTQLEGESGTAALLQGQILIRTSYPRSLLEFEKFEYPQGVAPGT